jgi:hypothetical protein
MKNKNPLLIPELREMLRAADSKTLPHFRESGHRINIVGLKSILCGKAAHALSPSPNLPCRIVFRTPDKLLEINRGISGNPLDWRVAP